MAKTPCHPISPYDLELQCLRFGATARSNSPLPSKASIADSSRMVSLCGLCDLRRARLRPFVRVLVATENNPTGLEENFPRRAAVPVGRQAETRPNRHKNCGIGAREARHGRRSDTTFQGGPEFTTSI